MGVKSEEDFVSLARLLSGFLEKYGVERKDVIIVAGFQGINEYYDVTTLGRGGSDTTAVSIAAALKNRYDWNATRICIGDTISKGARDMKAMKSK